MDRRERGNRWSCQNGKRAFSQGTSHCWPCAKIYLTWNRLVNIDAVISSTEVSLSLWVCTRLITLCWNSWRKCGVTVTRTTGQKIQTNNGWHVFPVAILCTCSWCKLGAQNRWVCWASWFNPAGLVQYGRCAWNWNQGQDYGQNLILKPEGLSSNGFICLKAYRK